MTAPRFEIVHKPAVATVLEGDQVKATEPNPQPWHVRIIGGNNEPTFAGETLTVSASADVAILSLAHMFGYPDAQIVQMQEDGKGLLVLGAPSGATDIPVAVTEEPA